VARGSKWPIAAHHERQQSADFVENSWPEAVIAWALNGMRFAPEVMLVRISASWPHSEKVSY